MSQSTSKNWTILWIYQIQILLNWLCLFLDKKNLFTSWVFWVTLNLYCIYVSELNVSIHRSDEWNSVSYVQCVLKYRIFVSCHRKVWLIISWSCIDCIVPYHIEFYIEKNSNNFFLLFHIHNGLSQPIHLPIQLIFIVVVRIIMSMNFVLFWIFTLPLHV